jgi:hypothetical protein
VSLRSIILFVLFISIGLSAEEPVPDWATRKFSSPPDAVFSAALNSIANQHYQVQDKDEASKLVRFAVGRSAFSWGYYMVLTVAGDPNGASNVSVEVHALRSPDGHPSLLASGKKEVGKIFAGIEKELGSKPERGK